jgi:DNA-binding NtrC family response regulator
MKEKVILLVDADADCAGIVLKAGARTGHGVRWSGDSRDAFGFLNREFDRIDSVVIDVDPGTHGMALLEAIRALRQRPPVIVLTGLEESHMEPVATRHGAAECLGKPVSIDKLKVAIERVTQFGSDEEVSCDPWGHPRQCGACVEDGDCA